MGVRYSRIERVLHLRRRSTSGPVRPALPANRATLSDRPLPRRKPRGLMARIFAVFLGERARPESGLDPGRHAGDDANRSAAITAAARRQSAARVSWVIALEPFAGPSAIFRRKRSRSPPSTTNVTVLHRSGSCPLALLVPNRTATGVEADYAPGRIPVVMVGWSSPHAEHGASATCLTRIQLTSDVGWPGARSSVSFIERFRCSELYLRARGRR